MVYYYLIYYILYGTYTGIFLHVFLSDHINFEFEIYILAQLPRYGWEKAFTARVYTFEHCVTLFQRVPERHRSRAHSHDVKPMV